MCTFGSSIFFWNFQAGWPATFLETGTSSFFWNFQKCTCNFYATYMELFIYLFFLLGGRRISRLVFHSSGKHGVRVAAVHACRKVGGLSSEVLGLVSLPLPAHLHDRVRLHIELMSEQEH